MEKVLKIRKRALPQGWYPSSAEEIQRQIAEWNKALLDFRPRKNAVSGVVPHAGWYFCGSLIHKVIIEIPDDVQTVVILGGHNPPGGPFIVYPESSWATPAATMAQDSEFVEKAVLSMKVDWRRLKENEVDNTVEVILPLLAAVRPELRWAAWRVPADKRVVEFADVLAEAALSCRRKIVVLGSTDLTHYGPNYGFQPQKSLSNPLSWVKENDKRILDALCSMDGERVLDLAHNEKSACSVGAALCAMSYARRLGVESGRVVGYSTSSQKAPGESFVGYGALVWEDL